MSQTTVPARLDKVAAAANDALTPEDQAKADAEHASTGWSAYDVWRTRVLAPKKQDPRGNR
jgi:hypothetical protein